MREETEQKVQELIFSYENTIRILNKEKNNFQQYERENQELREEKEHNWQEIVKMRNQLAEYTTRNREL